MVNPMDPKGLFSMKVHTHPNTSFPYILTQLIILGLVYTTKSSSWVEDEFFITVWRRLTRHLRSEQRGFICDTILLTKQVISFINKQCTVVEFLWHDQYFECIMLSKYIRNIPINVFYGRNGCPIYTFLNGQQLVGQTVKNIPNAELNPEFLHECFAIEGDFFYVDYLSTYLQPHSAINLYMYKNVGLNQYKFSMMKRVVSGLGFLQSKKQIVDGKILSVKSVVCSRCRRSNCSLSSYQPLSCLECRITFSNVECFAIHRKKFLKSQCLRYKRCVECNVRYDRKIVYDSQDKEHFCFAVHCKYCKMYVDEEHVCFLKSTKTEKDCDEKGEQQRSCYFADIEATLNEDGVFVPNVAVIQNYYGESIIYRSDEVGNVVEALLILLSTKPYHNATVYWFNLSYDANLIMQQALKLYGDSCFQQIQSSGSIIYKMHLKYNSVRFMCAYRQVLTSLDRAAKAFLSDDVKDAFKFIFPYHLNHKKYFHFTTLPSPDDLDFDKLCSERLLTNAMSWYNDVKNRIKTGEVARFNILDEVSRYCVQDVRLLRLVVHKLMDLFKSVSPALPHYNYPYNHVSLAAIAMQIYKNNFLPMNTIQAGESQSYHRRYKSSYLADVFIDVLSKYLNVSFRTSKSYNGEKRIPIPGTSKAYYADAFAEDTKFGTKGIVIDIAGCWIHSCKKCFPTGYNWTVGSTHAIVRAQTEQRVQQIRDLGYSVFLIWQCGIEKLVSSNAVIQDLLKEHQIFNPCSSQRAFGGRNEVARVVSIATKKYELQYQDLNSLYSYVMIAFPYPSGIGRWFSNYEPESQIPPTNEWIDKLGMVSCYIIPPKQCMFPVLPARITVQTSKKVKKQDVVGDMETKQRLAGDQPYDYNFDYPDFSEMVQFEKATRKKRKLLEYCKHTCGINNIVNQYETVQQETASLNNPANVGKKDYAGSVWQKLTAAPRRIKEAGMVKTVFALCKICASEANHNIRRCSHTDIERGFQGTYTVAEIKRAIEQGYRIHKMYQLYLYNDVTYGLFRQYIGHIYKIKVLASKYKNQESLDEAKFFFNEMFPESPILETDVVRYDEARRTAAKVLLNALFGKWLQKASDSTVGFVDCVEFNNLFRNDNVIINSWQEITDTYFSVSTSEHDDQRSISGSPHAHHVIGCHVTSYARLHLLKGIELLHDAGFSLSYCDTDSVLYYKDRQKPNPIPISSRLGEYKSEIGFNDELIGVIALASKLYTLIIVDKSQYTLMTATMNEEQHDDFIRRLVFETDGQKNADLKIKLQLKCKGLHLTEQHKGLLNNNIWIELAKNELSGVSLSQQRMFTNQYKKLQGFRLKTFSKVFTSNLDKRQKVFTPDDPLGIHSQTRPWGYIDESV